MEVVFLIGSIQTVFLSLLILTKKNRMIADKVLVFGLLLSGIHLLSYYLHTLNSIGNYSKLYALIINFPMLHGLFTFIYVDIITKKKQRLNKGYLIHLLPYIVSTIIIVIFAQKESSQALEIFSVLIEKYPSVFIPMSILNFLIGPAYLILSIKKIRVHRQSIGKWFSYTKNIDLNWLKYVIVINICIWIVVLIVGFLGHSSNLIDEKSGNHIALLALAIAVFFIGYFGIKQQVIYAHFEDFDDKGNKDALKEIEVKNKNKTELAIDKEKQTKKYKKSGLSDDRVNEIYSCLNELMIKDSYFKDEELTLVQLSEKLKVHPNHISQVINEREGKNFYSYINTLRVEEFIRLAKLPENKKYTVISLAHDCGFSAKSTFNKHFKLVTGKTPTQFFK